MSLQDVRELAEHIISAEDDFYRRVATMCIMIILSAAAIIYARIRKTKLSVFPQKFSKAYVIFTVIAAVLLVTTPSNFTGGSKAVILLIYGSIVTPVYEELVFRGYIWNRLDSVLSKQLYTYIWSVALFTVWHLGYMIPQLASGNINAVLWKLAAGVGYGTVLGFVRMKTKNCYSTMLLHGVLNIFMI